MSKQAYANAEEVLSKDLFLRLQKEFHGRLYVPASSTEQELRKRKLICQLVEQGTPVAEVAKSAGVTERRIRQIVQKMSGRLLDRRLDLHQAKSGSSPESALGGSDFA